MMGLGNSAALYNLYNLNLRSLHYKSHLDSDTVKELIKLSSIDFAEQERRQIYTTKQEEYLSKKISSPRLLSEDSES